MCTYTATYSPEDNKLRLYASQRLDAATYERVKAAGFAWAPKQEAFIAPMWTPQRADLCMELAGSIDEEDSTMRDRAEVRAERFEGYEERRSDEADAARESARRIMDGIPLGQPILIGHHSQPHAERNAKKIERSMQRAVDKWETAEYWKRRAAATLAHADYKARPDVTARRIKSLEADERKHAKEHATAARFRALWDTVIDCGKGWKATRPDGTPTTPQSRALFLANYSGAGACDHGIWSALNDGKITPEEARTRALASLDRSIEWHSRWLNHVRLRLEYERAMLGEAGGLAADKFDIQPGGRVLIDAEWLVVLRVNRKNGRTVSVTTNARYVAVRGVEEIKDYTAPTGEDADKVAKVSKLAPLCNYRTEGCREMTAAEWKQLTDRTDSAFIQRIKATDTHEAHRHRSMSGPHLSRLHVYITDAKDKPAPAIGAATKKPAGVAAAAPWNKDREPVKAEPVTFERIREPLPMPAPKPAPDPRAQEFAAMRQSLRDGVQVVSAPQLFPTPPDLAARMVEAADIRPGDRWLEPSAGTGRLVDAVGAVVPLDQLETVMVEVNHDLARGLAKRTPAAWMLRADFLEIGSDELQRFDVILMNPPFSGGADVSHITRALALLAPGGRLVAVASAGLLFRQDRATRHLRERIECMGGTIEELPPQTFASSGTGVNTVLVTVTAEGVRRQNAGRPAQAKPEGLPDARQWFALHGRFYRVLAEFDAADVAGANAYMHTHAGASLLATDSGRLVLVHEDDKGTTEPPGLDDGADASGRSAQSGGDLLRPPADEARAQEIAANTYEKRAGWADDGKPTTADLEEHAGKLEAAALQLDGDGCHQTAANYRRAAVLLRERKPGADGLALQIVGRMSAVDLFDYLADHAEEPADDARGPDSMRAAVLANVAEIGPAEFCRRMEWARAPLTEEQTTAMLAQPWPLPTAA